MRSAHDRGGNAGQRRAQARAAKSPRWSAERRAFSSLENAGRRKHGARASVVTRTTGCFAAPGRLSALRHPLIGVANRKRRVASREKGKRKTEKRKNGEGKKWEATRFVAWAVRAFTPVSDGLWAHAEQSTTLPRARSRAAKGVYARLRGL